MLSVVGSTFAGNSTSPESPSGGGGIAVLQGGAGSGTTSLNSIFQDPQGGDVIGATFHSLGHNLFSDAPAAGVDPSDLINTDPLVAPLGDYGGPTQTMALLPGSPAIDAGSDVAGVTTDQRGISRPQGSTPDIGAFESRGFTLAIAGGDNQTIPALAPFPSPLTVVVASRFGEPVAGGRVTFSAPATGALATLSGNSATIGQGGLASISGAANDLGGTYAVTARATGAGSVAFTLRNSAPEVVSLRSFAALGHPRRIVLSFSEPMDAAWADSRANYRLVAAGRDHRLGTRHDRVIRIRRARYDEATRTVVLWPRLRLSRHQTYLLTVVGTPPLGLTDTAGVFLDGADRPGSDYVGRIGPVSSRG